jgi:hypothetical protein
VKIQLIYFAGKSVMNFGRNAQPFPRTDIGVVCIQSLVTKDSYIP